MQPHLDRADLGADDVRDRCEVQLLALGQEKDFAVERGQSGQRFTDDPAPLVP